MEPQQQQQQHGKGGRPLPKFGEWDVNNPASADGFTVIFAKARDEKKAKAIARPPPPPPPPPSDTASPQFAGKKKWLCCFPVGPTVSKQQSLQHLQSKT